MESACARVALCLSSTGTSSQSMYIHRVTDYTFFHTQSVVVIIIKHENSNKIIFSEKHLKPKKTSSLFTLLEVSPTPPFPHTTIPTPPFSHHHHHTTITTPQPQPKKLHRRHHSRYNKNRDIIRMFSERNWRKVNDIKK